MATRTGATRHTVRGQPAMAQSLDPVVQETLRLWRRHHLGYDQTKYVVERVRRRLALEPPRTRTRTVARLERSEVERLIHATYRSQSKYGLMIKTLFQTGTRVDEFVHVRVADLLLDGDPPQIHITHAKRHADRYVPILPALADELRTHLQLRWDAFERNLLELPHQGFAAGGDLIYGRRTDWENWGLDGSESARNGRDYLLFTGYFLAAGPVPGVKSDRHRLIASIHAGIGHDLDRFSAQRVGGGFDPMGEEYEASSTPVLPGAVMHEFFPRHYLIATGEYRWEPVFFAYFGLDASVGRLDRLRQTGTETAWKNDVFTAVGARMTSGFLFNTRLELAYHYNFSVVRSGHEGGHEIILNVSRNF